MRRPILLLLLITLLIGSIIYFPKKLSNNAKSPKTVAEGPVHTYTPANIPLTTNPADAEILNPQRGYYRWRVDSTYYANGEVAPIADPVNQLSHTNTSYDSYERFSWDKLEAGTAPTGQDASDVNFIDTSRYQIGYDFIDGYANNARNRGGQLNFSIYIFCPDCSSTKSAPDKKVPQYIVDDTATYNGWIREFDTAMTQNYAYVPDWNDNDLLVRVEKLLKALALRYNDDPRIGIIDIRVFGSFGEWQTSCIYPNPSTGVFDSWCQDQTATFPPMPPNGQVTMNTTNRRRTIDMHLNAFTKKRQLVLVDKEAIQYTANTSTLAGRVGWRGDCMGLHQGSPLDPDVVNAIEHFRRVSDETTGSPSWQTIWNAGLNNRWQVAPITGEYCQYNPKRWSGAAPNVAGSKNTATAAAQQIIDYHISGVGNGNFKLNGTNAEKWATIPNEGPYNYQRDTLLTMNRKAGYRYELTELTIPQTIYRNGAFDITSKWQNVGNAPIYENWDVWISLRNTSTNQIWNKKSAVNLKSILSTESAPVSVTDGSLVDNTIAPGTYELSIIIRETDSVQGSYTPQNIDPTYYRAPLALAIQNRQPNGSYVLDNTKTVTIMDTPTNTATATDSPTPTFTATDSPTPTFTTTSVPTDSPTPTFTATASPSPTDTPSPTNSPSPTFTTSPSPTNSPTPTFTATDSPTPTFTATASPTDSPSPTTTEIPTDSPTSTVPTTTSSSSPTVATQTATGSQSPTTTVATPSVTPFMLTVQNNIKFTTSKPTLTGKTVPNARVKVTVYSEPQIGFVTADANGNWSFVPSLPLSEGQHRYLAQIINADNSEGELVGPVYFTINTTGLIDTGRSVVLSLVFGAFLVIAFVLVRLNMRKRYRIKR